MHAEVTCALLSLALKMLRLWTPALCRPSTLSVGRWLEFEQWLESHMIKMVKLSHQPASYVREGYNRWQFKPLCFGGFSLEPLIMPSLVHG